MTPAQVLREQAHRLTAFEQSEVLEYPQVYFIGAGADKVKASPVEGAPAMPLPTPLPADQSTGRAGED